LFLPLVLLSISRDYVGDVSDELAVGCTDDIINSPHLTAECDNVRCVPNDLKRSWDIKFVCDNAKRPIPVNPYK